MKEIQINQRKLKGNWLRTFQQEGLFQLTMEAISIFFYLFFYFYMFRYRKIDDIQFEETVREIKIGDDVEKQINLIPKFEHAFVMFAVPMMFKSILLLMFFS